MRRLKTSSKSTKAPDALIAGAQPDSNRDAAAGRTVRR
jgi:hypothetical protein